ncbi:hypothetical protein PanWU01x14_068120, partial [Parasponia andersonii]
KKYVKNKRLQLHYDKSNSTNLNYRQASNPEGDIEIPFSGESSDGEDKSKGFEEEQPKLSSLRFGQLGFQAHPTITPTRKATQIGERNIIISVHTPIIVGLSNILCKASTRAITPKQQKPRKENFLRSKILMGIQHNVSKAKKYRYK